MDTYKSNKDRITLILISITYALSSESFIVTLGEGHVGGIVELLVHLGDVSSVEGDLRGLEDGGLHKGKLSVVDESSEEPDEGLLELVVALGGDVVVLEVLLSVEGNLLGLDLSVLDIDLVAHQNNRDVLADSYQVLVPLGHVLVGNSGADIEHDDSRVSSDAIRVIVLENGGNISY